MVLRDTEAFQRFFERTFEPVYRFAFALSGNAEAADTLAVDTYSEAWLTWRRLPHEGEELAELMDEVFARAYNDFQRQHRLVGDADTLARLLASMIQRRWEAAGETRFRPDPAEVRPSRLRLLGPDPEAGEEEGANPPPPGRGRRPGRRGRGDGALAYDALVAPAAGPEISGHLRRAGPGQITPPTRLAQELPVLEEHAPLRHGEDGRAANGAAVIGGPAHAGAHGGVLQPALGLEVDENTIGVGALTEAAFAWDRGR